MDILDKHRLLEEGDEYLVNGAWKKVPAKDWGMQIMFSKYTQVRRPSEQNRVNTSKTISPSGEKLMQTPMPVGSPTVSESTSAAIVTAKAESDLVARPVVARGAGERSLTPNIDKIEVELPRRLSPTDQLIEDARRQAETDARDRLPVTLKERAEASGQTTVLAQKKSPPLTETEKAVAKAQKVMKASSISKIKFPNPNGDFIWTGRNGTFGCIGLDLMRWNDGSTDKVSITPIGKRGVGNCVIQFPADKIPDLIDWLQKQLLGLKP